MATTISGDTGIDKVADGADMPAGSVIQVIDFSNDTATNVTVADAWVVVGGTEQYITLKGSGGRINVQYNLNAEIDGSVANNVPIIRLQWNVNGGSWTSSNNSRQALNAGVNDDGVTHTSFMYTIESSNISATTGDIVGFRIEHRQMTTSSIHYNQSGIGSDTGGTRTHGLFMEIAG